MSKPIDYEVINQSMLVLCEALAVLESISDSVANEEFFSIGINDAVHQSILSVIAKANALPVQPEAHHA